MAGVVFSLGRLLSHCPWRSHQLEEDCGLIFDLQDGGLGLHQSLFTGVMDVRQERRFPLNRVLPVFQQSCGDAVPAVTGRPSGLALGLLEACDCLPATEQFAGGVLGW
jgi:hypothetical protein